MEHSPHSSAELPRVLATGRFAGRDVESALSDAGPIPGDPHWAGGRVFVVRRSAEVEGEPSTVFATIRRIGGENGYFGADWPWRVRGALPSTHALEGRSRE